MSTSNQEAFHPWFSMWLQPRATMQGLLDTRQHHPVIMLAALSGISQTLGYPVDDLGVQAMNWWQILLTAIVGGAIMGVITLFIVSWLLRLCNPVFRGRASAGQIRTAVAWSYIPMIWLLLLFAIELAMLGPNMYSPSPELGFLSNGVIGLFAIIRSVVGIWAIFTFVKCLAQVQNYSSWRALGQSLVALMLLMAVVVGIAFGIGFLLETMS